MRHLKEEEVIVAKIHDVTVHTIGLVVSLTFFTQISFDFLDLLVRLVFLSFSLSALLIADRLLLRVIFGLDDNEGFEGFGVLDTDDVTDDFDDDLEGVTVDGRRTPLPLRSMSVLLLRTLNRCSPSGTFVFDRPSLDTASSFALLVRLVDFL